MAFHMGIEPISMNSTQNIAFFIMLLENLKRAKCQIQTDEDLRLWVTKPVQSITMRI